MIDGAPAPAEGAELSIYQAAELVGKPRPEDPGDRAAPSAPAAREPSGDVPDYVEAETPPDETAEATEDEAGEPPIDPPRSWKKAEKERFQTLPRETQQWLVENESVRDREIQRGLQANAERERALTAERQAAQQARQQYEAALPQITQLLTAQHASEFGDIRTMADAEQLLKVNPPRYMRWQLSVQKAEAARNEAAQMAQAQQAKASEWYEGFINEQDSRFLETNPDYADPVRAEKLQRAAVETLTDIGFARDELEALMMGRKPLHARDHRVQLLVHKAARWDQAQKAAANAKAKSTPPVTRPGTAPDKGGAKVAAFRDAQQKLARSGRPEDAVALLRAQRAR